MKECAACIFVFVGIATGTPARAAILDQQQELNNGWFNVAGNRPHAQTFAPSFTGQLDHVAIPLTRTLNAGPHVVTVSIVETAGGAPTGATLGSGSVSSLPYGWDWYSIDFLEASIVLQADTLYGIVVTSDTNEGWIALSAAWDGDLYSPGMLWERDMNNGWQIGGFGTAPGSGEADMAFRTYMVPEPTTVPLLTVSGLGAIGLRRRRPARAYG